MKRIILLGALASITAFARPETTPAPNPTLSARELLALLPDGAMKRQFIVDCTGCHGFHSGIAYPAGQKRTEQQWRDAINRMLGFAGPHSQFPVISVHASADSTARWLAAHLPATMPAPAARAVAPEVTEFLFPAANDLPHDVAIGKDGKIVITGMFTHKMYVLDPATKNFETVDIPVERANPRAVEIDKQGNWWVVLGGPQTIASYAPASKSWRTYPVGMYPHSVALDSAGSAWFNGHFTVNPEQIGRVDASGTKQTFDVPAHPVMANVAGGPVPYEIRAARDGAIWGSELQGNRVFRFDPKTSQFRTFDLPTPHAGPRRLDIDARGNVWIPQYGAGNLAFIDGATHRVTEIGLPIANTAPYIARVDHARNVVWIATGAGDVVFAYHPSTRSFDTYHLPSQGALVRHMAIDERTGDVWLAYGASPGTMPARVARLAPRRSRS